jgi:hypothetical protein
VLDQILQRGGDPLRFVPCDDMALINLGAVPVGLNAEETERFLRENAAEICGLGALRA